MKLTRLIPKSVIFLSMSLLTIALSSQDSKKDLKLAEAWHSFQQTPSSENAFKLYQSLPDNPDSARNVYLSQQKVLQSIYEDFKVLEYQVLTQDRNSVKVAFRLISLSDGDFTETICIVLGRLIKINPQMFLQELKTEIKTNRKLIKILSGLVSNLGEQYINSHDASLIELEARIKALQLIKDKNLLAIRDECIAVLKETLNRRSQK